MANKEYNPDVLNCIANLSNDEVFTPPTLANKVLDMLPQELFCDPKATFVDPFCKSGVFLREIVKRLDRGLAEKIPNRQKRIDHIMHNQVFGIALTELTSLLSRRTLYCSKSANSQHSVSYFEDEQGHVFYKAIKHTWVNGKCKYCGASKEVYDRGSESEQYAYQFIHTDNPEKLFPKNMKFDVIIGNPPYQLSDGGGAGTSAMPIYQKFVEQAKKLCPRYLSMIIPARWYAGGKGLDEFRATMLHDKHIRVLVDFIDSNDCFDGVDIAGGVCYFLWDRDHEGLCKVTSINKKSSNTTNRLLGEYSTFIRQSEAINIVHKVLNNCKTTMDSIVYSRKPFGLDNAYVGKQEPFSGSVTLFGSQGLSYINADEIIQNAHLLNKWKLIASKASAQGGRADSEGKRKVLPKIEVLPPGTICTESYLLLLPTSIEKEAENAASYVKTMFFRFLLSLKVITQNISKDSFSFVPLQDFSHPWTDEMLYEKYGLDEKEISFIESMIRPME